MRSWTMTKIVVTLTAMFVLFTACGSKAPKSASTTTSSTPAGSSTSPSSVAPTSSPTSAVATTTTIPVVFPYLYVYPFGSLADAEAWQREANPGGHQPWHLDAGFIASSFVKSIGAQSISQVIKVQQTATDAHVALGFHNPNGVPVTAVTVHLVRVGSGTGMPWEVVGNDQSPGFTLTTPGYGATVASPVRVSGRISGVDESILVRVHGAPSSRLLGESCCVAAGGTNTSWATTVAYAGATEPVLVITAATGGHLQAIERLVFTAVHRGS